MAKTLQTNLSEVWQLDRIFPGGSTSPQLQQHVADVAETVDELVARLEQLNVPKEAGSLEPLVELVKDLQQLAVRMGESRAFSSCLIAQDVRDEQALIVSGRLQQLGATLDAAMTTLDEKLVAMSDDVWDRFVSDERVEPVSFALDERRRRAGRRMSPDKEALAVELGVEGYHGWSSMYNLLAGRMQVSIDEDGEERLLSVGQAANRLDDPDRDVRQHVFERYEEAWSKEADLMATTLNNLAGYRLTLYRYRGWDSVLQEPLEMSRMQATTLDAMWDAVGEGKQRLVQYADAKAQLLDLNKLSWFDVGAPVGTQDTEKIPYDEAARFIVEQFSRFGPRLEQLAVTAFNEGWIEAEDRPGKRPGGFCASLPMTGESRIFMTYGGRPQSVDTLAHELGHAYHFHVMRDLPPWARRYPMNLAETASTLAEMIVADGSLAAATEPGHRLSLLDTRLQRASAFLMDIHARFLFETDFYDARRRGPLTVDELNERMEAAQRKAFAGAIDSYHPLFWASKLHFHITHMPFYNFPYTFGYLFSAGIYARKDEYGERFPAVVDGLLRDTGRTDVEALAEKHLGVDLTKPDFWRAAVTHVLSDLDEFVTLAKAAATDA